MQYRIRTALLPAFLCLLLAQALSVQPAAQAKKPITHDAYDGWRSIQNTALTSDSTWVVYALIPQDGDGELVARNLQSGVERRHPRGKDPVISADDRYVIFTIAPPRRDVDQAKKAKKKAEDQPKNGLGILDLASGAVATADRVKSVKVPKNAGSSIAYLLEPPSSGGT